MGRDLTQQPLAAYTRRKRKPEASATAAAIEWFASHQIEISSVPLAVILLANLFEGPPKFSLKSLHPLHFPPLDPTYHVETIPARFLFLSYRDPVTGLYLKGADDFLVVVTWVLVWTFARETAIRYLFAPIGRAMGIKGDSQLKRFCEQGWGMLYAILSMTFGIAILCAAPYRSPTFFMFPTADLWKDTKMQAPATKFYYLVQMAFWVQTLIALNIEKRRKDFVQMFVHHVVTIGLIVSSYATNFTRIGNLILVQMDPVDVVLPMAKMTKYLGYTFLPDVLFGIFLITWVFTRHIFYLMTIYSVLTEVPKHIPFLWNPSAGKFLNRPSYFCFLALLVGLQIILLLWLGSIINVVIKVITTNHVEDVRSDSEDEPEELQEESEKVRQTAAAVNSELRQRKKG